MHIVHTSWLLLRSTRVHKSHQFTVQEARLLVVWLLWSALTAFSKHPLRHMNETADAPKPVAAQWFAHRTAVGLAPGSRGRIWMNREARCKVLLTELRLPWARTCVFFFLNCRYNQTKDGGYLQPHPLRAWVHLPLQHIICQRRKKPAWFCFVLIYAYRLIAFNIMRFLVMRLIEFLQGVMRIMIRLILCQPGQSGAQSVFWSLLL